jgi:hypothetical protein
MNWRKVLNEPILNPSIPTPIRAALAILIYFVVVFGIVSVLVHYVQEPNRNDEMAKDWVRKVRPSFELFRIGDDGLKDIYIEAFGGRIDVRGKLGSRDSELSLYRFLIERDPPVLLRMQCEMPKQ